MSKTFAVTTALKLPGGRLAPSDFRAQSDSARESSQLLLMRARYTHQKISSIPPHPPSTAFSSRNLAKQSLFLPLPSSLALSLYLLDIHNTLKTISLIGLAAPSPSPLFTLPSPFTSPSCRRKTYFHGSKYMPGSQREPTFLPLFSSRQKRRSSSRRRSEREGERERERESARAINEVRKWGTCATRDDISSATEPT